MTNLFLVNWSDINSNEKQDYLDYEALINSDDEFLCLSSLDLMSACDFDSLIDDEVFYYAQN